ncbi:FeoC-like transcriptional regulator [Corynebacterium auriscanis]|uniref:DprA-like winged helix domain-containing protein n=2 Tax=Corynebacterium auriscanis TaxID=99807 RepID=UPI0025B55CFE|nr:FeoC-like transcriptional regulator [Corynebacterium auriscanis]WJY73354.1 FeoC like transcriptional regulator [Corynebacterium auriscanis]
MGPLSKVMQCVSEGVTTVGEIARRTGLSASTVDAALLQLERMGRARKVTETMACSGACGGCDVDCGSRSDGAGPGGSAGTVTILKLGHRPA